MASHGGTTVRRVTTSQWQVDGANTPVELSQEDTTPNGLHTWSSRYGLTSESVTTQSAGVATTTATLPDLSTQITVSDHGRVTSVTRKDSTGAQMGAQTMSYADPFKRLTAATDARDGTTNFTYYADDQSETVTQPDPDGAGPLLRPVTHTYYDAAGRKNRDVLPDGGEVAYDYWPTGALKSASGARTYPVDYTYDPQGRMKTLTTYQGAGGAGAAVTTWIYTPTGRLQQKKYQNNTGPSYTYTDAGRLATRLWVRGITTTYRHNHAGEVRKIEYSDETTPTVCYGYDRRGLLATVDDASGSRTLTYTVDGQPDDDHYTAGMFAGITVDRGYDSKLRLNSLSVPAVTGLTATGYGYDNASRLQTVTSGTLSATYSRTPNSDLVGQIDFARAATPVMTTTKSYDFLDRLTSIGSTVAGAPAPVSSSAYVYNAAGQRTKQTREDSSYWSYGYDALGQVTSGSHKWSDGTDVVGQQFGYSFDQIGNRTATTVNGRASTYTPNLLNQYETRTVPGAVDVLGKAKAEAVVTVNDILTKRKGEYYSGTVPVDNSTDAVDADIKITGVRNNADPAGTDAVSEQSGRVFIPKTPENFSYDSDGNLTGDGRFTYDWDGENRLIKVESQNDTPTTAKIRLLMWYDGTNRRVEKHFSIWDPDTAAYGISKKTLFLYDGWLLIDELSESELLMRSYIWGLDLSKTLTGAGGVGGLLGVRAVGSIDQASFIVYDGGGNVTHLIDSENGILMGSYEYGPFGEPMRDSGPLAKENPYQFSSHYTDNETSLVYAKHRFYRPSLGSWISRDPLADEGFVAVFTERFSNRIQSEARIRAFASAFNFVKNDPIDGIDAFGLREFYVVGRRVLKQGAPNETESDKALRWLGRLFYVDHTSIYYGTSYVMSGSAARVGALSFEEEIGQRIVATLKRVASASQNLRWGAHAGTCCEKATDVMRLESLRASPSPTVAYGVFCANCQLDTQHALEGSCLTGWRGLGIGPLEGNYLTPEEQLRRALLLSRYAY